MADLDIDKKKGWEHTGEAGLHEGHLLQTDLLGDTYCAECGVLLEGDGLAEAWPLAVPRKRGEAL